MEDKYLQWKIFIFGIILANFKISPTFIDLNHKQLNHNYFTLGGKETEEKTAFRLSLRQPQKPQLVRNLS